MSAPTAFEEMHGRLLDIDSHLPCTAEQLGGVVGAEVAERLLGGFLRNNGRDLVGKVPFPDRDTVWHAKGWWQPGASDAGDRLKIIDLMGVDRQLLFPQVDIATYLWRNEPGSAVSCQRWNDFVIDWAQANPKRLRPVGVLNMHDAETAISEANRAIGRGLRAITIAHSRAPAGLSPAHQTWDPLWAALAEADVPLLFHIGGSNTFLDPMLGDHPILRPSPLEGGGEPLGPFELTTIHMAPQVYCTAMILGGVLERHPTLRVGIIEYGAQWVGSWAELLDQRIVGLFGKRFAKELSLKPSEYLSRQLRVTPFFNEPTGEYIPRGGLADVYAFSTDFPHPEGGKDAHLRMLASLQGHDDRTIEAFFCSNGDLLLP